MTLRRAHPAEFETLARFCADQFESATTDYFLRRWRCDQLPGGFALVQEQEGEVVGHARVFARRLVLSDRAVRCAALGNVAISASHRGRGLARSLLESCIEESVAEGHEVSMLGTHIPGLYERFGFEVVRLYDAALPEGDGRGWREAQGLTDTDRAKYAEEHASRPGTFLRDDDYWKARDCWLGAEGWRLLRHDDAEGYCYIQAQEGGGLVDEAVGDCARLLRDAAPGSGRWRWRVPLELACGLPLARTTSEFTMVRALRVGIDLASLSSEEAVVWRTDAF